MQNLSVGRNLAKGKIDLELTQECVIPRTIGLF